MVEEKTVSSRYLFKGKAINLRVDNVISPEGCESVREIVEHCDCIAVIPVNDEGDLLLVKQYRKAVEKELLEIPAGGIDPGETPEMAVKRELQEEIGYLPGRIEKLGGFFSSPGFSTEYLHLFLASDLTPNRLYAEDTSSIATVAVKRDLIRDMISSEEIQDAKTIAGLLYYLLFCDNQD